MRTKSVIYQRGFYMVWEINMGVCSRLEFDNSMFINCLGYDFCIYDAFGFSCNSIAILWRHVWYHYNTLGYPVTIISKVIDISCNRRRNVLLNNCIIDKFVDTINGFVCIRIVGWHSSFMTWYPNVQLYIMYSVKFGIIFLCVVVFVKIPFQHINYTYMLRMCRPNFMKFKDR